MMPPGPEKAAAIVPRAASAGETEKQCSLSLLLLLLLHSWLLHLVAVHLRVLRRRRRDLRAHLAQIQGVAFCSYCCCRPQRNELQGPLPLPLQQVDASLVIHKGRTLSLHLGCCPHPQLSHPLPVLCLLVLLALAGPLRLLLLLLLLRHRFAVLKGHRN